MRADRRAIHRGHDVEQQGQALGANHVVGRRGAALGHARKVRTPEKRVDRRTAPQRQQVAPLTPTELATEDRRQSLVGAGLWISPRHPHASCLSGSKTLGRIDRLNVPLVTLLRCVAEREQAMLEQEQALDLGIVFVGLGRELRKRETRHDVGHHGEPVSIDFFADRFRVRLVDQRKNRVRVGVIDKLVGKEPVQEGFDRGVR